MGLRQGQHNPAELRRWAVPAALAITAIALWAGGDAAVLALQYDRDAIEGGEVWRLLSGHLVHLGWSHLALNLLGLLLVWYLVGQGYRWIAWLGILAATVLVIDLGFWLLTPELSWYVGLSGVLHGVLAAGTIALWPERRYEALLLGAALVLKLVYETMIGPLPGSENTAGGNVITDAHLFGAIGGAVGALLARRGIRVR